MTNPDFEWLGENEFLSVRIGGGRTHRERLLLIGRPYDGQVRVRERDSDSWNTEGEDTDVDPAEILAEIETAYASALSVTPEIYQIRLWLTGQVG